MFELVPDSIAAITVHACTSDIDSAKVVEVAQPTSRATLAVSECRVRSLEVAQSFSSGRTRGAHMRIASQVAVDVARQCGRTSNTCWA